MTSTNGFLINTGVKLVLIDTGAGPFMGPAAGRLSENLKAAGYTPDRDLLDSHALGSSWRANQRRQKEFSKCGRAR